jgi:ribosomal protein S18 acetylase RimI-like enzyme
MTAVPEQRADRAVARRFARMFLRVELASVLSKDFVRPTTALLVASTAIFTALLASTVQLRLHSPAAAHAAAFLAGAAVATALYAATALRVEARSFAAAPHKWLLPLCRGWAGAYAKPDRRGRMTLYSVWASPRRQHLGSALMRQVCAEMDALGCDLQLVAVNQGAASFYRRFGFEQVRRGRFAFRMFRPCTPPARLVNWCQHR